jgi:hypothetical protein
MLLQGLRGARQFIAHHQEKTGMIGRLGPGATGLSCHILLHVCNMGQNRCSGSDLHHSKTRRVEPDSILLAGIQGSGNGGGWGRAGGTGGMGGPMGGPMGRHGAGYPRSPQPQKGRPEGKKNLERISKETGGRMFDVSKEWPCP